MLSCSYRYLDEVHTGGTVETKGASISLRLHGRLNLFMAPTWENTAYHPSSWGRAGTVGHVPRWTGGSFTGWSTDRGEWPRPRYSWPQVIFSVCNIDCKAINERRPPLSTAMAWEPQLRNASFNVGPPRFTQINSYNSWTSTYFLDSYHEKQMCPSFDRSLFKSQIVQSPSTQTLYHVQCTTVQISLGIFSLSGRSKSRSHKLIQILNLVVPSIVSASFLVNTSIFRLLCATRAEDSSELLLQSLDPIFKFLVAALKVILTSLDLG